MTAMIPVRTIGEQITESIILHQGVSKQAARAQAIDMLSRVKMSRPEGDRRLSVPVERRHASARRDRHGTQLPAQSVDCR